MEAFSHVLTELPRFIVLNKIDVVEPRLRKPLIKRIEKATKCKVFAISAQNGDGVEEMSMRGGANCAWMAWIHRHLTSVDSSDADEASERVAWRP